MKTTTKANFFLKAASILAQNRRDTAPYAGRLTEDGDSPRKKAAIKKLLGKNEEEKKAN